MIFYSARKIMNRTGQSSKRIFLAFKAHVSTQLPKNRYDPLYPYAQMNFAGTAYMINPHELINNEFRWRRREVAEYIMLASYRSYADYVVNNKKTLDLLHSPVSQETINNNRLLRIVEDQVHFYYEEDLKKREKIWH